MPSTRTMASYRLEILPWCSALITASSTSTCTCTTCSRHNTAEAEMTTPTKRCMNPLSMPQQPAIIAGM